MIAKYPTYNQEIAAWMAARCECGARRDQHEQNDGTFDGACTQTGCAEFEEAA